MSWLRPEDGPEVVYEFFSPFAHVEGRYEWCRIRSPTHGVFDCFILLEAKPVVVYVNSAEGARFMAERYPESTAIRVAPRALRLCAKRDDRVVRGRLRAKEGPVRKVRMTLAASPSAVPKNVPYGGTGAPVWGSAEWTCWGVDLVLEGQAAGTLRFADGRKEVLKAVRALVTLGSFGRIAPLGSAAVKPRKP